MYHTVDYEGKYEHEAEDDGDRDKEVSIMVDTVVKSASVEPKGNIRTTTLRETVRIYSTG
jgi:hypothetical protein